MAKDNNNNKSYDGDSEDTLAGKLLTTITKMDKVDTAFGSRFDELMTFQTILKTMERKINGLIETNEKKLEQATEKLTQSKTDITALSKEITTLKEQSQTHRDFITNNINRLEQNINSIKNTQTGLETDFKQLKQSLSKENKFGKVMLWTYRSILAVAVVALTYYHYTINSQIDQLNTKFNNEIKKITETRQLEQPTIPDKKLPTDNKSKSNKK